MSGQVGLPCGCPDREGHVVPVPDDSLGLEHAERNALNDDPLPHDVPGTAWTNGPYAMSPDVYCLCGHPNYLTCYAWANGGGLVWMTISRGPAYSQSSEVNP